MSLLRSVLKKGPASPEPGAPKKHKSQSSAASFKSTAQSFVSFYSTITGGSQIPKRRRPEISKLGAPTFCYADPPSSDLIHGAERLPPAEYVDLPFTAAHAMSSPTLDPTTEPYLSIVLFSQAPPSSRRPLYSDLATISGQVRLRLSKAQAISSIDIWMLAKMDCALEIQGPFMLKYRANLWNLSQGDPSASMRAKDSRTLFGEKRLSAGTYVFPFSFERIPQDVKIYQSEEALRTTKGEARLDFPPSYSVSTVGGFSGQIGYKVGVDVKRGVWDIDDQFDFPFTYLPRLRPVARPTMPFPLIPTREDWPYAREEVGGWTLTPFGGRGRFSDEMIEIEGILGTPSPPVYAPTTGTYIPFTLMLYSTNVDVLKAMSHPDCISVEFVRSDGYGRDALSPRSGARKNRILTTLGNGTIKLKETSEDEAGLSSETLVTALPEIRSASPEAFPDSLPAIEGIALEDDVCQLSKEAPSVVKASDSDPTPTPVKIAPARFVPTRFSSLRQVEYASDEDEEEPKSPGSGPSPTASLNEEDMQFPGEEMKDHVITLEGRVPVVGAAGLPSFRYKYMNREYIIRVVIRHPKYSHITPSGPALYSEAPVWIVSDPPATLDNAPAAPLASPPMDPTMLPVQGRCVPISPDACILKEVVGKPTDQLRASQTATRLDAF